MTMPITNDLLNTFGPTELETATGKTIDFDNPKPSQIDITDIAFGLTRSPRFVGQTDGKYAYNVALHSIWVYHYLYRTTGSYITGLYGLLHDAHEAYTGDIPTPLKNIPFLGGQIKAIQSRLQAAIYKGLNLQPPSPEVLLQIKHADRQALIVETEHLKRSKGIGWNLPDKAPMADRIPFYGPCDALACHTLFIRSYWELIDLVEIEKNTH